MKLSGIEAGWTGCLSAEAGMCMVITPAPAHIACHSQGSSGLGTSRVYLGTQYNVCKVLLRQVTILAGLRLLHSRQWQASGQHVVLCS